MKRAHKRMLIFLVIIIIIIGVICLTFVEGFSLTTGVSPPLSPGEISSPSQNNWVFMPSQGYFGPVKINYKLSDGVRTFDNTLLLNVQQVISNPVAANSVIRETASTSNYTFTGTSLFNKLGLTGGEVGVDYDRIRIIYLGSDTQGIAGRLLVNGTDVVLNNYYPIDTTFTYDTSSISIGFVAGIGFNILASSLIGRRVSPTSYTVYESNMDDSGFVLYITIPPPPDLYIDYLIVGGGGAGGSNGGGGGGAGGLLQSFRILSAGWYDVYVGAGGFATVGVRSGDKSSLSKNGTSLVEVLGGGGGGCRNDGSGQAASGGSGGGAGSLFGYMYGGTGTAGQGYAGGSSNNTPTSDRGVYSAGGGGGGSGSAGTAATILGANPNYLFSDNAVAGTGGAGTLSTITGSNVYYACGGGGGSTVYGYKGNAGYGAADGWGVGGATKVKGLVSDVSVGNPNAQGTAGYYTYGSGGGGGGSGGIGGDGSSGVFIMSVDNTRRSLKPYLESTANSTYIFKRTVGTRDIYTISISGRFEVR